MIHTQGSLPTLPLRSIRRARWSKIERPFSQFEKATQMKEFVIVQPPPHVQAPVWCSGVLVSGLSQDPLPKDGFRFRLIIPTLWTPAKRPRRSSTLGQQPHVQNGQDPFFNRRDIQTPPPSLLRLSFLTSREGTCKASQRSSSAGTCR